MALKYSFSIIFFKAYLIRIFVVEIREPTVVPVGAKNFSLTAFLAPLLVTKKQSRHKHSWLKALKIVNYQT